MPSDTEKPGQAVKVRFAPSPTGRLHVGNTRTVLINWLFARNRGGNFLLRMDDTDTERSTAEYEDGIIEDLKWLGLDWDDFARQSARMDRYDLAMERLKADGRLYPCFETQEELELKRKIQLGQGKPPVYDRGALALSEDEKAELTRQGRIPHWRFKLLDEAVAWDDLGRGPVRFEPGHLSDPVLVREDRRPLYTLSSVVDDGEMAITHVIRGEDHVANTAVQVQLFQALGYEAPAFAHMPLMMGADGKSLSKRVGSLSLADLRDQGIEPLALAAYLSRLGTSAAADGGEKLTDLVAKFDIADYGRASPRYEPEELAILNAKVIHHTAFADVKDRLAAMGLDGMTERFWNAVRGNIGSLSEAGYWLQVCDGSIQPDIAEEDAGFIAAAAGLLPPDPWNEATWDAWIAAVKRETGRKGKGLFMPLRKALTGRPHGPELKDLLPLIGRARVKSRLAG
ncbi:MAG: glutamate--tRNA ligase [Alphaproteobacteria bacterium]